MMLPLLIVTVLGAGGPHGLKPPPLPQAQVRILRAFPGAKHHPRIVAAHGVTGPQGRFYAHLRRGSYIVEAEREGRLCQTRSYSQTLGVGRVSLWCPIK